MYNYHQIFEPVNDPTLIRNLTIISQCDHGKATLRSLLGTTCTIKEKPVEIRYTGRRLSDPPLLDTKKPTVLSTAHEREKSLHLINFIDTPGKFDFSTSHSSTLRISDGVLILVDCVEGVRLQTENLIRQALMEKHKAVLMINKLDMLLELQIEQEEMYQIFYKIIEEVNNVIGSHTDEKSKHQVSPENGSVAFGSGLQGWTFTLMNFAKIYSIKFGVSESKLMKLLWGEHYFDAESKKWVTESNEGNFPRAFCRFCLDPICKLYKSTMTNNQEKVDKMLKTLGITLSVDEAQMKSLKLFKAIMSRFLNASNAILDMIIVHLPSPKEAQRDYRSEIIYTGPTDDKYAKAIKKCDPNGPLMMYISRNVQMIDDKKRFISFGRVFSGTLKQGMKIRILGSQYDETKKYDVFENKKFMRSLLIVHKNIDSVDEIPCGNVAGIIGIDQYLLKTGTMTNAENLDAFPFFTIKYSSSPCVKVSVAPKNAHELPKFVEGLKLLAKSNQFVTCSVDQLGESTIGAAEELQLELAISELKDFAEIPLTVSAPFVSLRETIVDQSKRIFTKSPNKHNRIYMNAQPMQSELLDMLEFQHFPLKDAKESQQLLCEKFQWEMEDAKKIWCFGPEKVGLNVLVDQTKQIQNLYEIKDPMVWSFNIATSMGLLCDEPMMGIRFNLLDVVLVSDSIHRGSGQIIPMSRRCLYGCQYTSEPRILEPILLVDVLCPNEHVLKVTGLIEKRRGVLVDSLKRLDVSMKYLKYHIPAMEIFGLNEAIKSCSAGKAIPQYGFDHWDVLGGSPFVDGIARTVALNTRVRKGLSEDFPQFETFVDKE